MTERLRRHGFERVAGSDMGAEDQKTSGPPRGQVEMRPPVANPAGRRGAHPSARLRLRMGAVRLKCRHHHHEHETDVTGAAGDHKEVEKFMSGEKTRVQYRPPCQIDEGTDAVKHPA
jgi:hypothetical protein